MTAGAGPERGDRGQTLAYHRGWRKRTVDLLVAVEDAELMLDLIASRLATLSVVDREDHIQLRKITALRAKVATAIGRAS